MKQFDTPVEINSEITVGEKLPLLICGPCVIETEEICMQVATHIKKIAAETGFNFIFKASFDKANRTNVKSYRGKGFDVGLEILQRIKERCNVPILTDIHLPHQAMKASAVADVLQIPAFLCRQTDLLLAAGETGKAVNIKKGQFVAPEEMQFAKAKINSTGNKKVLLTERGTMFGYNNLIVDMRSLVIMRQYAPVIFDATHSVQLPGAAGGRTSGQREFAPYLAKAAAAVGVDGFFFETHPDPENAPSDGDNMIPLHNMYTLLQRLSDVMKTNAI